MIVIIRGGSSIYYPWRYIHISSMYYVITFGDLRIPLLFNVILYETRHFPPQVKRQWQAHI